MTSVQVKEGDLARGQGTMFGEKAIGQFLRLAEFADNASYDELYLRVGGTAAQRHIFLDHLVTNGYIELGSDNAITLTSRGRRASRRLMKESEPFETTPRQ